MSEKIKTHWLTRRLNEIGKSKRQLALRIGVNPTRMNDLENGSWRFQAVHIRKAAEFLEFDRTAFLDFLAGDITEDELWSYQKPETISAEDMALLKAVKSLATRPQTAEEVTDSQKSPTIQKTKDKER